MDKKVEIIYRYNFEWFFAKWKFRDIFCEFYTLWRSFFGIALGLLGASFEIIWINAISSLEKLQMTRVFFRATLDICICQVKSAWLHGVTHWDKKSVFLHCFMFDKRYNSIFHRFNNFWTAYFLARKSSLIWGQI